MGLLTKLFGSAVFAGPLASAMLAQSPQPQLDLRVPKAPDFPKGMPIVQPVDLEASSLKKYVYLAFGERAAPLRGHTDYCERLPQECMQTSDSGKMVILDDSLKKRIERVNADVNATVKPTRDEIKYKQHERNGITDYWTLPEDGEGDCEDYVLGKMKMLREMGIPKTAMSIVFVNNGVEGHAILAVRTDRGDYLLDNAHDKMVLPHQTGYQFISATSMKNNAQWQKVALNEMTHEDVVAEAGSEKSEIEALVNLTSQPLEPAIGPLQNALRPLQSALGSSKMTVPLPPSRPRGL